MRFSYLFPLCFCLQFSYAQEQVVDPVIQAYTDEDTLDEPDAFELHDQLTYFRKHPISLNHCRPEELKKLIFLSATQIHQFFAYLKTHGKLTSIFELQAIPGFDTETVIALLPYVQIADHQVGSGVSWNRLWSEGNHDIMLRYGQQVQRSKGYVREEGSRYLGPPGAWLARYKYQFEKSLSFSLLMERDAGEPTRPFPFDFISASLSLQPSGRINKLIIGDYQLQYGQGITLWSGTAFTKGNDLTQLARKSVGMKPYSSSNELHYFRGIAAEIRLSSAVRLHSFLSGRKLDASLDETADGSLRISSLLQSGYHRTPNELANRQNTSHQMSGLSLQWEKTHFQWGVIYYYNRFDQSFTPGSLPYRNFYFSHRELQLTGVHYEWNRANFHFFGEVSNSFPGKIAQSHGVLMSFSKDVSMGVLYRDFPATYYNFWGKPFSESGNTNEKGLFTTLQFKPHPRVLLSVYHDLFKFPWLKYRIDAPSEGHQTLLHLSYSPSRTEKWTFRYKQTQKYQNETQANYLFRQEKLIQESFRLDFHRQVANELGFQSRLAVSRYRKGHQVKEIGWLIYQDVAYRTPQHKWALHFRMAYFRTPSYYSRLYAYEQDVLYYFGFHAYSGEGIRSYLNLKAGILKKTQAWLRYGIFNFRHQTSTGTGLDEVSGNIKADFKIQLRHQF